jgi:hypothetical protein
MSRRARFQGWRWCWCWPRAADSGGGGKEQLPLKMSRVSFSRVEVMVVLARSNHPHTWHIFEGGGGCGVGQELLVVAKSSRPQKRAHMLVFEGGSGVVWLGDIPLRLAF